MQAIALLFARKNEAGQETIPQGTEKAELNCQADQGQVSATFDLRKMVVAGKPDL